MRRLLLPAVALALALALAGTPASASAWDDCHDQTVGTDPVDLGRLLAGCDAVIAAGGLNAQALAIVHTNRGVAYYRLRRFSEAQAAYDRALAASPSHAKAIFGKAQTFCATGDQAASQRMYEQAIFAGAWPPAAAQSYLKNYGFYDGLIDGTFNPATRDGLRRWTAQHCRN